MPETMMRVFNVNDKGTFSSYPIRDSHINVAYGESSTAAATAAKEATLTSDPGWGLKAGSLVTVKFTYSVPANATLNVAGTGAKSIYLKGQAITGNMILAGDIVTFMYDGTKYVVTAVDRLVADINDKFDTGDLISSTQLTNVAADAAEAEDRVYPVRLDANGKLAVNVPWTENGDGDAYVDLDVTIRANDWTLSNGAYEYTYTSNYLTSNSGIQVLFKNGIREGLIDDIHVQKRTGSVKFTISELPENDIPLILRVISLSADYVFPVADAADLIGTDAVSGQITVQGALEDLDHRVSTIRTYGIDESVTIQPTDWLGESSPFTYSWSNSEITNESTVEVEFRSGSENSDAIYLEYEKFDPSGNTPGGVLFSSPNKPTIAVPITIRINCARPFRTGNIPANEVTTDAVTGANTVQGALESISGKVGNVASGSTLQGQINTLNTNVGNPSSASAVTGDDAFAKITSLNNNITALGVTTLQKATQAELDTAIINYLNNLADYEVHQIAILSNAGSTLINSSWYGGFIFKNTYNYGTCFVTHHSGIIMMAHIVNGNITWDRVFPLQ